MDWAWVGSLVSDRGEGGLNKFLKWAIIVVFWMAAHCEAEVLTTVASIRELGVKKAEENHKVKLKGVVTYYSNTIGNAFLWDGTGSIFFHPGAREDPDHITFEPGELVEIEGVTVRGRYSPSVAGAAPVPGEGRPKRVKVRRLGWGELPEPEVITAEEFFSGRYHDQFVTLEATIRSVRFEGSSGRRVLNVEMSGPQGLNGWGAGALIEVGESMIPMNWVDKVARLTGVVSGSGDDMARLNSVGLRVPFEKFVEIQEGRIGSVFESEPLSIEDVFRFDERVATTSAFGYVHIQSVVTLIKEGQGIYVGSDKGGLWIQTPATKGLEIADVVSVVGVTARDDQGGYLQDGIVRRMGRGKIPAPIQVDLSRQNLVLYHGALLEVQGELLDDLEHPEGRVLFLKNSERRFQVRVNGANSNQQDWRRGSWLGITGICELPSRMGAQNLPNAVAFQVSSVEGIKVIKEASWWTQTRVWWLVVGLVVAVAFGFLLVGILQRRVVKQAHVIADQASEGKVAEERQRIARELHDTLEQQLAGVQMHLDAVADWLPAGSDEVHRTVKAARSMLDHSRAETRRSVFELRSPALEKLGLVGAVKNSARQFSGKDFEVLVTTKGEEISMRRLYEFQVLRMVQEAMTNVVKHAGASSLNVIFDYSGPVLTIEIADNGVGFDTSKTMTGRDGRFGLLGVKERAAKVEGKVTLESSIGKGTRVILEIPLKPK